MTEQHQLLFKSIISKLSHYKTTQRKDALIQWKTTAQETPSLWYIDIPALISIFLKCQMDAEDVIRQFFLHNYLQSGYLTNHLKNDWLQGTDMKKLFLAYFKMSLHHLSNDIKKEALVFVAEWLSAFPMVFLPILQECSALLENVLQAANWQVFGRKNIIAMLKIIFKIAITYCNDWFWDLHQILY